MPPSLGKRLDNPATASARGTKKSPAASTHNVIEPGPVCAAAASQRMPATAAILKRTRSRSPSSRRAATRAGTAGSCPLQYCGGGRHPLAGGGGAHRSGLNHVVGAGSGAFLCAPGARGGRIVQAFSQRGRHLCLDAPRVWRLARVPLRLVLLAEQPVLFPEPAAGGRGHGGN